MLERYDAVEAHNAEAVRLAFTRWAAGTGSPFELLAADAPWTIVGRSAAARRYPDREAFLREVIRPFNARLRTRLVPTVREMFVDTDVVTVLFDAEAVARNGQPYVNTYAWILKMNNGQIVSATAFFDSIAFNELWSVEPKTD